MNSLVDRFSTRLELHQSPMHARAFAGIGWETHGEPGSQIFLKKLGPVATAKLQRPQKINWDQIRTLRRRYHTLVFYLEPGLGHPPVALGLPAEPFSHSATGLLDLALSNRALLASFSQKTRYNVTHTLKQNRLKVVTHPLPYLPEASRDDFFALRTAWSKRKSAVGHEYRFLTAVLSSYAGHGWLHLAYVGNQPVAGLLVLENDRVATYFTAYSTPPGNQAFAPTLLTWTSMQVAKSAGCDLYDFGGVYDPRYPKRFANWQGFTQFKAGFRPTLVSYPETRLQILW